jgi:glycosyltransferase involved in cell wall biosynthesis
MMQQSCIVHFSQKDISLSVPRQTPHISVVTPVYGCAACLHELYHRLLASLSEITDAFEIIMVNDESPDEAWQQIDRLARTDSRLKGISLSRNFGQHQAIAAGLDLAQGDWVIVIDCDLQDRPEEISKLYQKAQEGYDVVFGCRINRTDSFQKRMSSKLFFSILTYLTDQAFDNTIGNFSIISRKVVRAYHKMHEQHQSYRLFIQWLGFKSTTVDINHAERATGKSSYSLSKLLNLAFDSMVAYSNKPLRLTIKLGFLMALLALLYGSVLIWQYFSFKVIVPGWTSVMVAMFFLGGLILANLGVLGLYLGKVFNETKNRPIYIIDKTINFELTDDQND